MKNIITILLHNGRIPQFICFYIVGAIAIVVDVIIFFLLRQWMSYQVSMMISYAICLCLNMFFYLVVDFQLCYKNTKCHYYNSGTFI